MLLIAHSSSLKRKGFNMKWYYIVLILSIACIIVPIIVFIIKGIDEAKCDEKVMVKSSRAVDSYNFSRYIKENGARFGEILNVIHQKKLENKEPEYVILVKYVSPAGRSWYSKKIILSEDDVLKYKMDPSLWMSKSEYNRLSKEISKEQLEQKRHKFYDQINAVIDSANANRNSLIISGDKEELDKFVANLFDRTVNSINKIKDVNSEEWNLIGNIINTLSANISEIIQRNKRIADYYKSQDFLTIKQTVSSLMQSQKEFNEYINQKAQSISSLFGTKIVRNETDINDEYDYIRPYKKSLTPFTAEVSAQVFASAENSPLEYIVKTFYPHKELYPEQIQKLQHLIEELETLREAKEIIENYKKDYQKYITTVPSYILENDKDGFYANLGFANISESILTVEYKFSYTSGGGFAQRSFTVPMTEETIVELINILQSKLTMSAFSKEQRALMTDKLRTQIKERDNFTCKICGNSTHNEPNLLLEIDHIIPVAKGGCTTPENLQTLCWKCNRNKSDKLL